MALVKEGDENIQDFAKRFLKAILESLSEVINPSIPHDSSLQYRPKKMKGNKVLNTT